VKILVTGGAGYIGSHTVVELLNNNHEVIIVDNFSNSKPEVLENIKKITGKDFKFYQEDLINKDGINKIFDENKIDAVIDFAAFKAVGESTKIPVKYYINNVSTILFLLEIMEHHNVKKLVFSSSATVYGTPEVVPITEDSKTGDTTNPYGTSKFFVEKILKDLYASDNSWDIAILRYFNPVGAHESGLIGEEPVGIPANLMPFITKVAKGELEELKVFGNDYDTEDGTGIRDYIHVVDLAIAHLKALDYTAVSKGIDYFNVGTGNGYSVLEMVKAFGEAWGAPINYKIAPRRPGDVATSYADPTKAKEILGWEATRDLKKMCEDSARWQKMNPDGYPD